MVAFAGGQARLGREAMLKLSKKVDYALIALMHLAKREETEPASSAREIASAYGVPQDLLAKILQKLTRHGLVLSHQGTKGGYQLARVADAISVMSVVEAVDGPPMLLQCVTDLGTCQQFDTCNVKTPLSRLNDEVMRMLSEATVASMCVEELRSFSDDVSAHPETGDEVRLPVLRAH